MKRQRLLWLFYWVILAAAVVFLYEGWRSVRRAIVVVEWSTASELNTVGFNLFRAESPQGELTQVNTELIPASTDPLTGGNYKYEDNTAEPGRTYYYTLEDVDNQGRTSRFGPIEVNSGNSGLIELIAALVLAFTGVLGLYLLRRMRLAPPASPQPPAPAWDVSTPIDTPADTDETWGGERPASYSVSLSLEDPTEPDSTTPARSASDDGTSSRD